MSNRLGTLSLEFFPPKNLEGKDKLIGVVRQLMGLKPSFCSVTFGAGGSTQQGTTEIIEVLMRMGASAAPHLSCVGTKKEAVLSMLKHYESIGVRRIVALRGDLPSGIGSDVGDFSYASELVGFIREHFGSIFRIEVAAYPESHPQSLHAEDDLKHFAHKVAQGADAAITQYFFNADAYWHFVESARRLGITIPIVPGIMPITNYGQLKRFSTVCGAEIPRWMEKRLLSFGEDKASILAFGIDFISDLCDRLISSGAPGLHFYTLNQARPTLSICANLGVSVARENQENGLDKTTFIRA